MSITRQISFVNLIPAIQNEAGYFSFEGTANSDFLYKAWNLTAEWTPEFFGAPTDIALSGRLRSNFRGYRLRVTLQLDNSTESSKLRTLFNYLSGGFDRTFYALTTSGTGSTSTSLQFTSGAPAVADYFNGLVISGLTGGDVVVTDYTSGRLATLAAGRDWTNALAVTAKAQPNVPTRILFDIEGTSTTYTDSDLIPCVVTANNYGVSRQSTIHQQRIGLELTSVELYKDIPDSYLIA
jgi:hypothetical protein